MTGKPKFLFGGEEGTYEDFERKLNTEIAKAGLTTEFKKKSFLYKHLTGGVLDNLTKLIFPTKISEKSFEELLETLKNHYIPNKHLRERVLLYARIQEEEEATKDFFECLKSISSRCKYKDDVLKVILCDKVLTGIRCPHLRESLFVAGISPSCTAEQYMEYALLFEVNIRKDKLAKEKKGNKKNGKLNINNNIERSPSPNPKKPKSDSPAAKFGVSLKKNNDNNNNNKNGNKSPLTWEPKVPLTPQSTFGVTLKSKSTSQVSPKSSPVPNSDAQKENTFPILKPISNGTTNRSNSMSSPKSNGIMTIPEIMEPVKETKKPAVSAESRKILEKHGFVPKTPPQRESSWSPSPSPESSKPIVLTLEAKKNLLDRHIKKKEPPKPPPRREPSWSPSPSPEPRDKRSQETRGRSSIRDPAPKLKRSSSNLNVRDKPSINESSPTNTAAPAPKLKRSCSIISLSRDPRPEPQKAINSNRALREALPVLKSVKNLKPEAEPMSNRERFDISDLLPKLRPVGGLKQSPSEILDFLPEIPEITEPRKPTITAETQKILDKYCNKAPPKMDPPQASPRREPSYSPSPEPEGKSDLTRKQLFDKYTKPATTHSNKSSPYSDLTKSDIFEQFLQARNSPTSSLKAQKQGKGNKPVKKDEVPQLTDEDRRKLEEKYGIIKGKPKEAKLEESPKPERKKSPSRAQQSRELFEEKVKAATVGVVKASDRVVQMYKDSQQEKEALEDAALPAPPDRSNSMTPTTPTEKPLITIKASPKIAEMYKAQIEKRDKSRCPSPPPEKVTSTITRFADKKWASTLDLSSSKKEYDAELKKEALKINAKEIKYNAEMDYGDSLLKVSEKDSFNIRTIKTDLFPQEAEAREIYEKHGFVSKTLPHREPSWSPSLSPEPKKPTVLTPEAKKILDRHNQKKETPNPPPRREPSWSPSPSPEPRKPTVLTPEAKNILDSHNQKTEPPKSPPRREPSWSPIPSPEPRKPTVLTPEAKRILDRLNKKTEPPKPPPIREPSWSPSPSREPTKSTVLTPEAKKILDKHNQKTEPPKPPPRREPSWSPSPSPESRKPTVLTSEAKMILDGHNQKKEPPKPPPRREPSWSPSPSPEPRDKRSQDTRGRNSIRDPAPKLKRASSNLNVRYKPSINDLSPTSTAAPAQKLKRSCSTISLSRNPTRPLLTDEDRRKLEEKYGIIKGKPMEHTPEESPKPERKKSPSRAQQSRELFEEKTKAAAIGVVKASDRVVQMYKDSQQVKEALEDAALPAPPERSNGITPRNPYERPLITIKASPKIAAMYKAQIEKRDKVRCPSPPPNKVTSTITRFADKKWASTLDLSSSKKEHDAALLKMEALKINAKEIKYNAEMDYGDSLLKVSERDSFNIRTIRTDLFPQEGKKPDSPGPSVNRKTDSPGPSIIPPKPGTAAAAKPQFDISSFFDGSSYNNFLQLAKSTKGGGI